MNKYSKFNSGSAGHPKRPQEKPKQANPSQAKGGKTSTRRAWRPDEHRETLSQAVGDYEKTHPHWQAEVLFSLIEDGLKNLRRILEEEKGGEITWESPFVELRFPVEWNWDARCDGGQVVIGPILGKLTIENTADQETARTLAQIMVRHIHTSALRNATNNAWFQKQEGTYTLFVSRENASSLNAIKDKRELRAALQEIFRPFPNGAATLHFTDDESREEGLAPKRADKKPANTGNLMEMPKIVFDVEFNGRELELTLVFQIQPMMADYDKKEAYYPITVGLRLQSRAQGSEVKFVNPAEWPRTDREILWAGLFGELDKLRNSLIPQVEQQASVIPSLNIELIIRPASGMPECQTTTIKNIAFSQIGDLGEITVNVGEPAGEKHGDGKCPVCGWRHDLDFLEIELPDGQVIALRGVLPGIVNAVHTAHEKGMVAVSTKGDEMKRACGGYQHPCKAFDDLKCSHEYKRLFDTSRRGFISLRRVPERIGN